MFVVKRINSSFGKHLLRQIGYTNFVSDLVLGIDAGASSCKWAVLDLNGLVLANGRSAPFTGHVFSQVQREATLEALQTLFSALSRYKFSRVVAGITGLTQGDAAAQFYEKVLLEKFHFESVKVMSDMDLAYLAHFKPAEGILVYAGTGGIGYHLKTDGTVARAGGRGYLIADPGGGFSIGQKVLEFVTTQMDVSDSPVQHPLAAAVFEVLGSSDWAVMREHVYTGGRSAVAAFAPLAGQVAATGNTDAIGILELTGQDIAMLAKRLVARVGTLPIALAGGALRVSPLIERSARAALPNLEVSVTNPSFAVIAAQMALQL